MNDVLRFVLDGLEAYLELERELGVRTVEADRKGIIELSNNRIIESTNNRMIESEGSPDVRAASPADTRPEAPADTGAHSIIRSFDHSIIHPFVFIADKPLSPKAVEMMAKIIPAMGQTAETAPVVVAPPIPKARFFVFLGRAALAKYMPALRGEENRWLKSPKGADVLLVKSPEEIVRFTTVTPALKRMKQEMWLALKTVVQRVNLGA